jgi:hypothetical protein
MEAQMLSFLSKEVRDGLELARKAKERRKSKLRVQVGDAVFPVLRFWHDGLALEAVHTTHLRGLVDIYDGAKHIFQCLIVASETDGDELVCSFKRATAVLDSAALDYERNEHAPIAYLPKT